SALIINLKLSGTCIRDTDLFQKEITRLLNSEIQPVYNQVKQFARLLPVYFNEIGAEGELRDVSTRLDEETRREDRLIHFLRKQCHVESSNLILGLIAEIVRFWRTGSRSGLERFVPQEVLETVSTSGQYFDDVHLITATLFEELSLSDERALLTVDLEIISEIVDGVSQTRSGERNRVVLLVRFYQLLNVKYTLGHRGIEEPLQRAAEEGIPAMDLLLQRVRSVGEDTEEDVPEIPLEELLDGLEALKAVILSPETYDAREEIFQKRHIAAGIPSVYGKYSERKFDALALTFRLEGMALTRLEVLADRIPDGFVNRGVFFRVIKYIRYYLRALSLDGIATKKLELHLGILVKALELNTFSFPQYLDIFRNFSEGIRGVINTYYTSHHHNNLALVIPTLNGENLLPRYRPLWEDEDPSTTLERITEAFMRDLIAETFGLQAFDNFISRLMKKLANQGQTLSPRILNQLMIYDPANLFCEIHNPTERTRDLIHLGNKGYNLIRIAQLGMSVPDGVILTTEYYRNRRLVRHYLPAIEDFRGQIRQQVRTIEQRDAAKCRYGDPKRPLLLSVRSGALISMPGMMQTIHNVGINQTIVEGLVKQSDQPFFAWDNYRRFIQSWAMAFDVEREVFGQIMRHYKGRLSVEKKRQFSDEQMRSLTLEYHSEACAQGVVIPDDPWEQLHVAVEQVINSWNATKAKEFRRIMNIADEWGTAVVIQSMVFGNVHNQAGTGVLFTAHPHRKLNRVVLWGDYTIGNQGEDIVGGLVSTQPISLEQCQFDGRDPDISLERRFPEIYLALLDMARMMIYERRWSPQEIEFTFDGPQRDNLFLLQTRNMVTFDPESAVIRSFTRTPELENDKLAQGIGASGGALCGYAVFDLEQIMRQREKDPEATLILIRYDTVPDDIKEISLTEGLLTSRGGQTSHGAVVAARLKKTCVVGCEPLVIRVQRGECIMNGVTIRGGDQISIDGATGLVLKGWHAIETNMIKEFDFSRRFASGLSE
ncbi:MAG: phosphoenolpyruvate synthase, partial [Magnetococcales bacterium]|nr:phosphoenolpyruvate synthase [Magnetococcales bacterium]